VIAVPAWVQGVSLGDGLVELGLVGLAVAAEGGF
jgi:hypothetical protein